MAYSEPGRFEILAETLMLNALLSSMYRTYVADIGLHGDERVLELGPGSGALTKHLAPLLRDRGHLTEVDVTQVWIERLRRRYGDGGWIDFIHADVREAPLVAGSYDVVLVHWMLHDVEAPDRQGVITALARLLRPAGRLFLREPTKEKHGIGADEVRRLTAAAGLPEEAAGHGKTLLAGRYFAGRYVKPEKTGNGGLTRSGGLAPSRGRRAR